jgi:hypothetical protein
MLQIGITERGDAALDTSWLQWVIKGNPAILITKDPTKLYSYLNNNMNVIIHCTITGLPKSIEPNVPDMEKSIQGLRNIQNLLGIERVVLRVDPILYDYKEEAINVIKQVLPNINRIRISFMDLYPHSKRRLNKAGVTISQSSFHEVYGKRKEIFDLIHSLFVNVEVCGEPGFDGIGCISNKDLITFGISDTCKSKCTQRSVCNCLGIKTELLNNKKQCKHGCLYCYWK